MMRRLWVLMFLLCLPPLAVAEDAFCPGLPYRAELTSGHYLTDDIWDSMTFAEVELNRWYLSWFKSSADCWIRFSMDGEWRYGERNGSSEDLALLLHEEKPFSLLVEVPKTAGDDLKQHVVVELNRTFAANDLPFLKTAVAYQPSCSIGVLPLAKWVLADQDPQHAVAIEGPLLCRSIEHGGWMRVLVDHNYWGHNVDGKWHQGGTKTAELIEFLREQNKEICISVEIYRGSVYAQELWQEISQLQVAESHKTPNTGVIVL